MSIIEEERDYYELLGISSKATPGEIKHAYRTLARKYHPDIDTSQTYNDLFRQITAAFKVLSDPDKRNEYNKEHGYDYADSSEFDRQEELRQAAAAKDKRVQLQTGLDTERAFRNLRGDGEQPDLKLGHKMALSPQEQIENAAEEPEAEAVTPWGDENAARDVDEETKGSILSNLLNRLGVRRKKNRAAEKARLRRQLDQASLPLGRTEASIKTARPRASAPLTSNSGGSAPDPFRGERVFHFQITPVEAALGTSREIAIPGVRDEAPAKVRVRIPADIISGTVLQVTRGWDRVKVRITVADDLNLYCRGNDVFLRVPVTVGEAVNGGDIDVPTIDAYKRISLPPYQGSLDALRVERCGLAKDGEPGDLWVEPFIVPPNGSNDALNAAVHALEQQYESRPNRSAEEWREFQGKKIRRVPVTLGEAMQKTAIEVEMPDGTRSFTIPRPWNPEQPISLDDRYGVAPFVVLPSAVSPTLKDAARAIDGHYQRHVRENMPRRLVQGG